MQATPWALDELPMPDIFPMSDEQERAFGAPTDIDLHAHFAAERTHLEADSYQRGYEDGERAARMSADARFASAMAALAESIASVQLHSAR